jgi:L-lactate dehydrogenase complex protein LldG
MEREPFLAELSARLGRPRPRVAPVRTYARGVLPVAELASSELPARFAHELTQVSGEVVLARSQQEVRSALSAELRTAERVVTWAHSELTSFELDDVWRGLGARCREPTAADFREALLGADAGVTAVDYALAETGTLVLAAGPGRPRGVSLLPRLHVALVRQSQLVPRMDFTWARYRQATPSAVHFITGPSRTSDIENDLSIGVHGPARVLVILLLEASA